MTFENLKVDNNLIIIFVLQIAVWMVADSSWCNSQSQWS